MFYLQGQLAMDWYESTRRLLPPPCGTDASGNFTSFFLKNASDGTPAHWPSPFCSPAGYDLNYDFSQPEVVDYYVNHIALPLADSENLFGLWFDDTNWLACYDMCNEVHDIHLTPCDLAAKERLFNGTIAWKTAVATALNKNGQIPIFSSVNSWDMPPPTTQNLNGCSRNEEQVTKELAGLKYGRFYEGWSGKCPDIVNIQNEAEAGIAVFANNYGQLNDYDVASFLMGAGNQSFFASCTCWTDPCTSWHPQYYDQRLGPPKGPGQLVNGSTTQWRREFEFVNVTLDCFHRTANFEGWNSTAPSPAPVAPPTPSPAPPPKGQWSPPYHCTSCNEGETPLQQIMIPVTLAECESACVNNSKCTAIGFGVHQDHHGEGCQLFASCDRPWHYPGCHSDEWWTTYLFGR